MSFDVLQQLGTDFAKQKQFEKLLKNNPNAFVGWVDSYDEENKTVNVLPAMQDKILDSNEIEVDKNKQLIINCWVLSNTLTRNPQCGDKAILFVLDEKSNAFFKTDYNSSTALSNQTFARSSKVKKTTNNCVAIIINGESLNSVEQVLYDTTGENTDGSMTQKATTDELVSIQNDISSQSTDILSLDSRVESNEINISSIGESIESINTTLTDKANIDASNITDTSWISKLLSGAIGYGMSIVNMSISTTNSGIRLSNGIQICWGYLATTKLTVSFPFSFSSSTYSLISNVNASTTSATGISQTTSKTVSGFYIQVITSSGSKYNDPCSYIAIGQYT